MAGGKGEKKGVKRQKKGASPEKRAKVEKDTPPPPPPPPPRTPSPELTEEERKDLKRRFKMRLFRSTIKRVAVGRSPFSDKEKKHMSLEYQKTFFPPSRINNFDEFHLFVSQNMKTLRSVFLKGKKSKCSSGFHEAFSPMSFFFTNLFPDKSVSECVSMDVDDVAPLFFDFYKKRMNGKA